MAAYLAWLQVGRASGEVHALHRMQAVCRSRHKQLAARQYLALASGLSVNDAYKACVCRGPAREGQVRARVWTANLTVDSCGQESGTAGWWYNCETSSFSAHALPVSGYTSLLSMLTVVLQCCCITPAA